jgi:hypothetical protein
MIEDLLEITVKIQCLDDNRKVVVRGSGTVISDGKFYYVMTASHCIKKNNSSFYEVNHIEVISYSQGKPQEIEIIKILEGSSLDDKVDCAVLQIQDPQIDFDFKNRIKRCEAITDLENYFFYGYGGPNNILGKGRKFDISRLGKDVWHLNGDDINNQYLKALDLMGGNSGAGIFF